MITNQNCKTSVILTLRSWTFPLKMVVSNLSPIPQKQSTQKPKDKFKGMPYCPNTVNQHVVTRHFFFLNERKRFIYFEKQAKTLSYWTKYKQQTSWDGTAKYSQKITLRNPFKHFRAQPAEVSPGRLHLFHWKRAGVESQERTRLRLAPKNPVYHDTPMDTDVHKQLVIHTILTSSLS